MWDSPLKTESSVSKVRTLIFNPLSRDLLALLGRFITLIIVTSWFENVKYWNVVYNFSEEQTNYKTEYKLVSLWKSQFGIFKFTVFVTVKFRVNLFYHSTFGNRVRKNWTRLSVALLRKKYHNCTKKEILSQTNRNLPEKLRNHFLFILWFSRYSSAYGSFKFHQDWTYNLQVHFRKL